MNPMVPCSKSCCWPLKPNEINSDVRSMSAVLRSTVSSSRLRDGWGLSMAISDVNLSDPVMSTAVSVRIVSSRSWRSRSQWLRSTLNPPGHLRPLHWRPGTCWTFRMRSQEMIRFWFPLGKDIWIGWPRDIPDTITRCLHMLLQIRMHVKVAHVIFAHVIF